MRGRAFPEKLLKGKEPTELKKHTKLDLQKIKKVVLNQKVANTTPLSPVNKEINLNDFFKIMQSMP